MNTRTMILALAVIVGVLSAQAVKVHNTVNKDDSRWFTTGCKFESALSGGEASIGIWVKNITGSANPANIFGNVHVNAAYPSGGLAILLLGTSGSGEPNFVIEGVNSGGNLERCYLGSSASKASLMTDGKWHFILGTYSLAENTAKLYIDGIKVAEKSDMALVSIPMGRCFAASAVGTKTESSTREKENYGAGITGLITEATLWNCALDDAAAAELYTRRALPWENGLIGYWPLASDSKDWALVPATRSDEDRTVPDAMFYFETTSEDSDFFDEHPTVGGFVIPPALAAAKGYEPTEDCNYSKFYTPATNIQDAVNATTGKTVYVVSGYYPLANTLLLDHAVSVQSYNPITRTVDSDGTVVDGLGACRVLNIERAGNKRTIVDSLTLTNGNACVRMYNPELNWSNTADMMELRNCRIVGNRASSGASGVYVGKQGLVSNCVIRANHGATSGVFGWTTDYGSVSTYHRSRANFVIDCLVEDNTCDTGNILGAGANCILFQHCTFRNNGYAGAANNDFAMINIAGDSFMRDCVFENNATSGGKPTSFVSLYGHNAMISNCVFRGNGSYAYGIRALENQLNAQVWDTEVSGSPGIDVLIGGMSVHNSLFIGNGAGTGYRYHASSITSSVENCTFVNFNRGIAATKADGDMLLRIVNTIAKGADRDIGFNVSLPRLAMTNCCIATMSGTIANAEVHNRWDFDPGFADPEHGDYSLRRNSPCREKGILLPWMTADKTDIAGNPRVFSKSSGLTIADDPSALPDLGCYESQTVLPGSYMFIR